MSDSRSQANKQSATQSQDLASLRKSNRPKKPSLLYADGFEDTQKVIGNSLLLLISSFLTLSTRPQSKHQGRTLF